jgi:hypothetical protein
MSLFTPPRKANKFNVNDIYRILGPDAFLAFSGSVHDVAAFGSTCKENANMFLNQQTLINVFNENLKGQIRDFNFDSIKHLMSFLVSSEACISGSFLLKALGMPVMQSYEGKPTDMDLFVYCDTSELARLDSVLTSFGFGPLPTQEEIQATFGPLFPLEAYYKVHNNLIELGYTQTGVSKITYKNALDVVLNGEGGSGIFVCMYSRTNPVTLNKCTIEVILVNVPTDDHIRNFDIDICGSRLGVVSKFIGGRIVKESVVEFPNMKAILKKEARINRKDMFMVEIWRHMWEYDYRQVRLPGPDYEQAKGLRNRVYKYYARGFSFPEVCLPKTWDEFSGDPNRWTPLLHDGSKPLSFKRSLSALTDNKIYKTIV